MEENADGQMETDVSSTTQDTPPPQGLSEPTSSMEVSVEVTGTSLAEEAPITTVTEVTQNQHIDSNSTTENPISTSVVEAVASVADQPDGLKSDSLTIPDANLVTAKAVGLQRSPVKPIEMENICGNISIKTHDLIPAKVLEKPVYKVIKLKRTPPGSFQKSPDGPVKMIAEKSTINSENAENTSVISPTKIPEKAFVMSGNSPTKTTVQTSPSSTTEKSTTKSENTEKFSEISPTKIPEKAPVMSANLPTKSENAEKSSEISPTKIPEKAPAMSANLPTKSTEQTSKSSSNISEKIQASALPDLPSNSPEKVSKTTSLEMPEIPVNTLTNLNSSIKIIEKSPDKITENSSTKTSANSLAKVPQNIVTKISEKPLTKTSETPLNNSSEKTPTKFTETTPAKEQEATPKANKNLNESSEEVVVMVPVEFYADKEASNDSQTDMASVASESSEKEHNKSISREMKSLINSAKESKIISEALKTKTRKSRTFHDSSNTNLNSSNSDAEKIISNRRESTNSLKSNTSEKSDKAALKRSMRSQNPEFVNKQKQFLTNVIGKVQKDDGVSKDAVDVSPTQGKKTETQSDNSPSTAKNKNPIENSPKSGKLTSDLHCWRCHYSLEPSLSEKAQPPGRCTVCPRAYHHKCLSLPERAKLAAEKNWVCPKCLTVMHAESSETRSPLMRKTSLGMLCELLNYALKRMMDLNGMEPFLGPVDRATFPDYDKYIVHPVDLSLMKANIAAGLYGSTEAFVGDAQWILHNSIIFNTHVSRRPLTAATCVAAQSKLTAAARALVRSCRAECGEVEACPECYAAAHARRPTWFTDVCSTPHILLWAKLKGFPYWPAKGMSVNSSGMVDVRFFGAHDRAWVPARDCYLYSEKDPNNFRAKRQDIIDSMQEAEQHIRNISRKFGKFVYQEYKVLLNPVKIDEQLKLMIPSYEGDVIPRKKGASTPSPRGRSTPKGSKDSINEGGKSDDDEPTSEKRRKIAEGADNASEPRDTDKRAKPMEVDATLVKEGPRKRRKSTMEEASTFTVMSPASAKRSRLVSAEMTIMDSSKNEANKVSTTTSKPEIGKIIVKLDPKGGAKPKIIIKSDVKASPKVDKVEATTPTAVGKADAKATPTPKLIEKADAKATSTPRSKSDLEKKTDTTPRATRSATPSAAAATKQANNRTPKDTDSVKKINAAQREKSTSSETEKPADDKQKPKKDRASRVNTSLTSAGPSKPEKSAAINVSSQENTNTVKAKPNESLLKPNASKNVPATSTPKNKTRSIKDNIFFDDDDTSLAVLAKKNVPGGPMVISNVRSLTQADVAVKRNSERTPTSTDNALAKLQKLRHEAETTSPLVGRVGVRSFARMTSPPAEKERDQVEVEVKAEPMDVDELERQKADLLNSIQLRPVNPTTVNPTSANPTISNPTTANLRQMRITRIENVPSTSAPVKKPIIVKPADVRPKARKTFPQPQKAADGRSELNSKNSMVYIPIQPPPGRPPARAQAGAHQAGAQAGAQAGPSGPAGARPPVLVSASSSNNQVNTVTTPLMTVVSVPSSMASSSNAAVPPLSSIGQSTIAQMGSMGAMGTLGPIGMGQVPTTVHTVPLITSVNGQWTFSLQPMMSVGGVDELMHGAPVSVFPRATPPPLVNGVAESLPAASPACDAEPLPLPLPLPHRTAGTAPAEPPRPLQKPPLANPLDPSTPPSEVTAPSSAGPVSARLNQNAAKLAELFRSLLTDSLEKLDNPAAAATALRAQLEQATWRHRQQLDELKHNHELLLTEMRMSFEKDKLRIVAESRRAVQQDLVNAVKHAKSRQWCANCQQEAQFYCCWNTSYCDYPCQRAHWAQHFSVCTQARTQDNGDNSVDLTGDDRLQPPENPPALKKTTQPTTNSNSGSGKPAPSRMYQVPNTNQPNQGKPSIIVSMMEDTGGNQTVKCVGTYKPAANTSPSLLLNKQIMNEENANSQKKMVSSGGYLIVGAGATGSPSVVIN